MLDGLRPVGLAVPAELVRQPLGDVINVGRLQQRRIEDDGLFGGSPVADRSGNLRRMPRLTPHEIEFPPKQPDGLRDFVITDQRPRAEVDTGSTQRASHSVNSMVLITPNAVAPPTRQTEGSVVPRRSSPV